MKNLNLCTDPWLPVRLCSGECVRVGLEDFFSRAHEISDLVLVAHEKISIMRLLICIAQRAIDGPEDSDEWELCMDDISSKAIEYLKQWRSAFYLLGEDGAFLQVKGVEACKNDNWGDLTKLSLIFAEGNNPTVFDNAAGSSRHVALEQIAIDLITIQNFAPGGTIGVVSWNGEKTGVKSPDSAPSGPCTSKSAIHLFICGKNMLESLWLNLCSKEDFAPFRQGMGRPVWEYMPEDMNDEDAIKNATLTYLGRLVPLSRVVKISPDASACLFAKGLAYPVYTEKGELQYFESTMTITLNEKNERHIVGADLSKAMWRSLPALLHRFSIAGKTFSRVDENDLPPHYSVWVGALVLDQAKILGTMEDCFEHLSKRHVGAAADKVQASLMQMADRGINSVYSALSSYHALMNDPFDNKKQVYVMAACLYWSKLTAYKELYVQVLGSFAEDVEKYRQGVEMWASSICKIARDAFTMSVSRSGVRELAAWVRAGHKLSTKKSLILDYGKQ